MKGNVAKEHKLIMRMLLSALACALCLAPAAPPALAAETPERDLAAAYVREQGIMVGDEDGNLNLDAGLTRAEMAALLVRLQNGSEVLAANTDYFMRGCKFVDVPPWAKLYVGYCVRCNLVAGYDSLHYGASDPVTPAAACTVVLRARDIADGDGSVWSYGTACSYAASLGWIDQSTANAETITRGEMAVLIYRAMTGFRPVAPQSTGMGDGYLTNGKPITEANVLELLRQLEKDWPNRTVWGSQKIAGTYKNEVPGKVAYSLTDAYWVNGTYGCGGYANMISSLLFGDTWNPARRVEDLTEIRPGDVLFLVRNNTDTVWHVIVALESPDRIHNFHYTDGNHGSAVYWPDPQSPYSRQSLDCFAEVGKFSRIEAWTRYPASVPYTGESIDAWGIPAPITNP